MTRIALLALAVLGLARTHDLVRRGPPLICYEIDIGSAKSLPWGPLPESRPSNETVIAETQRILAESDDALVHMETLRRAYSILGSTSPGGGISGPAPTTPDVARFGSVLKDAVLVASLPNAKATPNISRGEALAWFDLGYFLAIKENCLHGREVLRDHSCHPILERAAAAAPHDPALRFGVAFGQLNNGVEPYEANEQPQTAHWHASAKRHLSAAMDMTKDAGSLLAKNMCALMADSGPYGPPTTFAQLRKQLEVESRPK